MNYRDNLKERNKYKYLVDALNLKRETKDKCFELNEEIKRSKFKYKFYNQLLKGGNNENKN